MTERKCAQPNCWEPSVSGGQYCEDHLIERGIDTHHRNQIKAEMDQAAPAAGGSLADMIRKAKAQGILSTLRPEYAHSTP